MSDQPNQAKKILIVDDDRFLLDMYALKFAKAGYEAKTCDSPSACLSLLRGGYAPDVMLCDIVMPGMDGLDMVAAVRKEGLAQGSLVIMLTNQSSPEDLGRAGKLSIDGYIVKATTIPSEVLTEVEKIIRSKTI